MPARKTKTKSTAKKVAKKRVKKIVVEPVVEIAVEPSVLEKPLPVPQSPLKVWVGVIAVMTVIVSVWIYSLRFTLFQSNTSLASSVHDANVDTLVKNIQAGWNDLQATTNQITTQTNTVNTNPTPSANSSTTDSLFSDLR